MPRDGDNEKLELEHIGYSSFGKNKELLVDSKYPVVIFIYADYCSHCTSFKPEYRKFVRKTNGNTKHLAIQIDGNSEEERLFRESVSSRDTSKLDINFEGVPTVLLYIGKKFVSEYNGEDRTQESLINWLESERKNTNI